MNKEDILQHSNLIINYWNDLDIKIEEESSKNNITMAIPVSKNKTLNILFYIFKDSDKITIGIQDESSYNKLEKISKVENFISFFKNNFSIDLKNISGFYFKKYENKDDCFEKIFLLLSLIEFLDAKLFDKYDLDKLCLVLKNKINYRYSIKKIKKILEDFEELDLNNFEKSLKIRLST